MVLKSRSHANPCRSFFTTHVSPSSSTIFPNRMPRAYMLGIVTTYSGIDNCELHEAAEVEMKTNLRPLVHP